MVRGRVAAGIGALAALAALVVAGCAGGGGGKALTPPKTTVAPYDTLRGEALWAVIPLRNESGTTQVDVMSMSDKLVAAVEQVEGVRALPLNRTLAAMRALEMQDVRSPGDARRVAQALGADGVLVGSITAYDPYLPLVGLSMALFPSAPAVAQGPVDPSRIAVAPTESRVLGGSVAADRPVSVVSEVYDARNHQVQMDVRAFAMGRTEPVSALGWERYLRSAVLFEEFAVFSGVERLVRQEWVRTAHP